MNNKHYIYTSRNCLDETNNYSYSRYSGEDFIDAWFEDRELVLQSTELLCSLNQLFEPVIEDNFLSHLLSSNTVDMNLLLNALYHEILLNGKAMERLQVDKNCKEYKKS